VTLPASTQVKPPYAGVTLEGWDLSIGKLDKAPVVTLKADAKEQVFFANVFLIQDHAK